MMTNIEKIQNFLKKDYGNYCDDCLSDLLDISPRQQVNQICNNSDNGICSNDNGLCINCNKRKKTRFVIDINNPPAEIQQAMSWAISYDNCKITHASSVKAAEKHIKEILDADFESNLFIKLKEFSTYVCTKSNLSQFDSFAANSFINTDENYKKEIWDIANSKIKDLKKISDFGSGNVLKTVINCIEIPDNNLLQWQAKQGPESRVHSKLYEILESKENLAELEESIWKFYFTDEQPEFYFFDAFTKIVNKKYALIAYLYFLKDKSKYLPLATNTFDSFFEETEVDLRTTKKCSWENYYSYISIMEYIRTFLRDNLDSDACLIDAHSFVWILERQYKDDISHLKYKVPEVLELKEKDKETVVKARTGQGLYRKRLLEKWNNKSSVSEYTNISFMIASHIKPWKVCDNKECIDPDNGLLLTPAYDFLFDQGYISFNDDGSVIVSSQVTEADLREFSFDKTIKVKEVSDKMKEYLEYHRRNVFKE